MNAIPGPEDTVRVELENGIVVLARSNFNSPSVMLSGLWDENERANSLKGRGMFMQRRIRRVVMIAVVPALANAVSHAIGKRFYDLPITPEKIRGALA